MKRQGKHFPKLNNENAPSASEIGYSVLYVVGIRTVRCVKSAVRFTRTVWRPIAGGLHTVADLLLLRHLRAARASRFQHKKVLKALLNVTAPVLAAVVLFTTISYWQQADYALALEYGGEPLGYIAGESAYAQAKVMVNQSVINADGSFAVEAAPQMTLSVIKGDLVLTDEELRDRILAAEKDTLVSLAGLYVDVAFKGALDSRDALQKLLDEILEPHKSDKYDGVDFFDELTIVEGLYPVTARVERETLHSYLKTLPVKTITNIRYSETVKYSTARVEDATQPLGYEAVKKKGVNGKQWVNGQIIRVNGKEMYRTVVSTEVIKEPVEQVITIGVQKYSDTSIIGDGVATGTFIWPLPYTKYITSPFASRWGSFHGAIDISGGNVHGKPIIASDGGTVVKAEYHSSYGNYVLIDHGNGFKTRYAHCSALNVEEGQKVAQGEYIGKVGNTGYSFGAHLHFEVIKDGKLVNPLDYVQR